MLHPALDNQQTQTAEAICNALFQMHELAERAHGLVQRVQVMRDLWLLINSVGDPVVVSKLNQAPHYGELREFFAPWWAKCLFDLEVSNASSISECDENRSVLAMEGYVGLREELGMLPNRRYSSCLMVGCGPYPETLVGLARAMSVSRSVVGVDGNPTATAHALALLTNDQQLSPDLVREVICCKGQMFDYRNNDLVFVANGVYGKSLILERIFETSHESVHVLVRTPTLLGTLIYEDLQAAQGVKYRLVSRRQTTKISETMCFVHCNHRYPSDLAGEMSW